MAQLNYQGNIELDPDLILGPDMYGAYYRPKEAVHDPDSDVTTIKFSPGSYAKHAADVLSGRTDEQLGQVRRNALGVSFWRSQRGE